MSGLRATATAAAAFLAACCVVVPPAPAVASACGDGHGVVLVVDPHGPERAGGLGGAPESVCDPSGGGLTAARLFERNGFPLTYVASQPGFVCRVAGRPADDPCAATPPDDAYWSLWWSDGRSGWSYAATAAGSLTIPDGGLVAFSWDGVPGDAPPRPDPTGSVTAAATTASHRPGSHDATRPVDRDEGLPTWLAPVAIAVLFGAAGTVAVVRRRRGTGAS